MIPSKTALTIQMNKTATKTTKLKLAKMESNGSETNGSVMGLLSAWMLLMSKIAQIAKKMMLGGALMAHNAFDPMRDVMEKPNV